jgi:hypothetical protein
MVLWLEYILDSSSIFDLSHSYLWNTEENKNEKLSTACRNSNSMGRREGDSVGTAIYKNKGPTVLGALEGVPVFLPSHFVSTPKFAHLIWLLCFGMFNTVSCGNTQWWLNGVGWS